MRLKLNNRFDGDGSAGRLPQHCKEGNRDQSSLLNLPCIPLPLSPVVRSAALEATSLEVCVWCRVGANRWRRGSKQNSVNFLAAS